MRSIRTIRLFVTILGAGSALGGPAMAEDAAPAPADDAPAVVDEARTHFRAGVAYLEDPQGERYEEAYAEFKKAYELSGSPKVLGNVALCAMMLERDGEAIAAYTRYLREVPDIEPEERAQNTRDLETMTASAAHLALTAAPAGGVKPGAFSIYDVRIPVRGPEIVNAYGPFTGQAQVVIRPGRHVISVKIGEHESSKWEVSVVPGAELSHQFEMERPPDHAAPAPRRRETPSRVGPILLMSVGGAALATAGVLGVVSLSKTRSLEDRCPGDACPPDAYRDVDSARSVVRATDFLFLGGGLVTAAGLGWFILSAPSDETPTRRAGGGTSVALSAAVGTTGAKATLRMGF